MPVTLVDIRKVAVVQWSTEEYGDEEDPDDVIKGAVASLQAEGQEKRTIDNDGEGNLFFPMDFEGEVEVTVRGSDSGESTAILNIT